MPREFKYKSIFKKNLLSAKRLEGEQLAAQKQILAAKSSELEGLSPLLMDIPEDENPDLLATAFNIAVVNLVNENDDAVGTDGALLYSPKFVYKPLNIEHIRSYVVGHITSQAFSSFGENEIISAEDLKGSNDPFNICLGGIVWRIVEQGFADYLEECSKPSSCYHNHSSTSWEIGFDDYHLILGSKKVKDAEIITDAAQIKEMSKYLRAEGGPGYTNDGTPIYRLVAGDWLPLGGGFTSTPAAAVKGVLTASEKREGLSVEREQELVSLLLEKDSYASEEEAKKTITVAMSMWKSIEAKKSEGVKKTEATANKAEENQQENNEEDNQEKNKQQKSSQTTSNTVIFNDMKISKIEDITKEVCASEEAAPTIREFIKDQLRAAEQDGLAKLNAEAQAKADAEAKAKEEADKAISTAAELKSAQDEIVTLKNEIQQIKDQSAQAQKEASFNDRMSALAESYDLDEKLTTIVAKQIRDLDEKQFSEWQSEFAVMAKNLVKSDNKSGEESAEELLKKGKESTASIPNTSGGEEDEFSKLALAFKIGNDKDSGVRISRK